MDNNKQENNNNKVHLKALYLEISETLEQQKEEEEEEEEQEEGEEEQEGGEEEQGGEQEQEDPYVVQVDVSLAGDVVHHVSDLLLAAASDEVLLRSSVLQETHKMLQTTTTSPFYFVDTLLFLKSFPVLYFNIFFKPSRPFKRYAAASVHQGAPEPTQRTTNGALNHAGSILRVHLYL